MYIGRSEKREDGLVRFFLDKVDATFQAIFSTEVHAQLADIAVDGQGSVYATGMAIRDSTPGAARSELVILNSFLPTADQDAVVMKLPSGGGFPLYSTLLSGTCVFCLFGPGSTIEIGHAITVDDQNRAYVAATSDAEDFPTTDGSKGLPPNRVSSHNPVVFVLDSNAAPTTQLHTRLEEHYPVIKYTGTWFSNSSPSASHSGGAARLATDRGSTFSLSFTGAGDVKWFGCRDPYSGIARVSVDGTVRATVDTFAPTEACRQELLSVTNLPAGNHTLDIEVTGTRNSSSQASWIWIDTIEIVSTGDIAFTMDPANAPPASFTRIEENGPALELSPGWFTNAGATNSGSRAVLAIDAGTRATLQFTGTAVRWIGLRDQWSGIARVFVDGVLKGEVDSYSAVEETQRVLFSLDGLSAGNHTLTVEVTGRRNPAAVSSWIWIDAFDVSGAPGQGSPGTGTNGTFTRIEQNNSAVTRAGVWYGHANPSHSGGNTLLAVDANSKVTFSFTGTDVRWIGLKDPWSGLARVFVDGVLKAEVDTYSADTIFNTELFAVEGLAGGRHTLTIEVEGRRNPNANSSWVWVDAFEFR
jgi:hypothetical protein